MANSLVIDGINTARERGANSDLILKEIMKQNPKRNDQIQEAVKRGANPDMIIDEIIKQNTRDRSAQNAFGVGEDIVDVGVGIGKGAVSTVMSVPRKVSEIFEATAKIQQSKAVSSGIQQIQAIADRQAKVWESLQEGDLRKEQARQALISAAQDVDRLAKMNPTSANSATSKMLKWIEPKNTAQKIGFGIEKTAEFIAPGSLIKKGEKALTAATANIGSNVVRKTANVLGRSAIEGTSAAVITGAQGGDLDDVARAGFISAAISVPFKAVSEVRGGIGQSFQRSAEKKASQALGATTLENKRLSDKIVPELLKRRVTFWGRTGLRDRATGEIDEVGNQLESAYNALPQNSKVAVAPIIQRLEDAKSALTVKGANAVPSAAKGQYRALQNMQDEILSLANGADDAISLESLRSWRQISDRIIEKSGKGFGLSLKDSAKLSVQKEGTNAVRNAIAQEYPQIGKINAEFNFWSNVRKVVGATIDRTKSQATPLSENIAEAAGAAVAGAKGGGFGSLVMTATGFRLLKRAIQSPAWRQFSAVQRQRIADRLISGDGKVLDTLNRIINAQFSGD